jgi:hypothetical protein
MARSRANRIGGGLSEPSRIQKVSLAETSRPDIRGATQQYSRREREAAMPTPGGSRSLERDDLGQTPWRTCDCLVQPSNRFAQEPSNPPVKSGGFGQAVATRASTWVGVQGWRGQALRSPSQLARVHGLEYAGAEDLDVTKQVATRASTWVGVCAGATVPGDQSGRNSREYMGWSEPEGQRRMRCDCRNSREYMGWSPCPAQGRAVVAPSQLARVHGLEYASVPVIMDV